MSTQLPTIPAAGTSTRPYLVRALHEWCTDNGFTPYIAVFVGNGVQVPAEHVKNNEIVLNIAFEATTDLHLGNEVLAFKARFGGVIREISVPMDNVIAIYARENGQGMAFPFSAPAGATPNSEGVNPEAQSGRVLRLAATSTDMPSVAPDDFSGGSTSTPPESPSPNRPSLKRIK